MKKYLIGALLCALVTIVPLAAQTSVSCDGCTHVVSYYMGEGGLIATAAEDAEMVNWLASCGGVTRTGMLTPNDDGVVSTLFSGDLACAMDGGKFEIGPVMDGGWYWITDAENSAVGGLVDINVLMNDHTAEPTGAGDGVTMTKGSGATFLKETSTGRVGILPTILPVMDMEPVAPTRCGFTGAVATAYKRLASNCMLGDGGAVLRAQGPLDHFTGKRGMIANGGMVTRPTAAGTSVTVLFELWGNGTGHFNHAAGGATGLQAALGHAGGPAFIIDMTSTYGRTVGNPPAVDTTTVDRSAPSEVAAGLGFAAAETGLGGGSVGTLTITPNADYCDPTAKPAVNNSVEVSVIATASGTQTEVVTPNIDAAANGRVAVHKIMVGCPSASAKMGTELVPGNPFPVE